MKWHDAYLGLGSNLGDRRAHIEYALQALMSHDGIEVVRSSSIIETDPIGPAGQSRYLNAVAYVRCALAPRELLKALLSIEMERGRIRDAKWGPRTIDIDILLFENRVIQEESLSIPHPHMHERLFVLDPLCELAPDLVHPVLGQTIRALRTELIEAIVPRD